MRPKTFGTFRETCCRLQLFKVWIALFTHKIAIQRLVLSKWIQLCSQQKFIQCSQVRLLHWDYKSWSHNFFQRLIFYIYFVRYFLVMFLNLIEFRTFFCYFCIAISFFDLIWCETMFHKENCVLAMRIFLLICSCSCKVPQELKSVKYLWSFVFFS